MRSVVFVYFSLMVLSVHAQDKPSSSTLQLQLIGKAEAAAILAVEDEFVERQSPFDRSARLKTDQPVDKATYLKFVAEQALDWSDAEKETLTAAWQRVVAGLANAQIQAPSPIKFIKTTGLEEGDAAYTRGTAIVLPKSKVGGRGLDALLAHELFHVLSRNDAQLRERLYKIIGFRKCGELQLPADLQVRRLTNPDAPVNNHCIQVKHDGKPIWVIPVLLSKSEKYDKQRGGEFFSYLQFQLMAIQSPDTAVSQLLEVDGKPVMLDPRQAEGFADQIGKNTGYIIHPDEILADNFSFLLTKRTNLPQPELLDKIEKALSRP